MRFQHPPDDAIEQGESAPGTIHLHDLPPDRSLKILADDVFPAQEQVARLHLPAVAVGGYIPAGYEALWIVLGAADVSGQPIECAGVAEFAPEHAIIFGQAARVVTLHIDDEPAVDLHGRNQSTVSYTHL